MVVYKIFDGFLKLTDEGAGAPPWQHHFIKPPDLKFQHFEKVKAPLERRQSRFLNAGNRFEIGRKISMM